MRSNSNFISRTRAGGRSICRLLLAPVLVVFTLVAPAFAERTVTDQLGREVVLPDRVERVVTLQHQTLDILVELNAHEMLVGVLRDWQKLLPQSIVNFAPALPSLPTPGDLRTVNAESIAALEPDVVFVTHYMDSDQVAKLERLNIPVVKISLFTGEAKEIAKLNPELDDEANAYTAGLAEGVKLIARVVGRDAEAQELLNYSLEQRQIVIDRTATLPEDKRVSMYMANPDLGTYGTGKYTGVAMAQAGGKNVAAEIKGFGKVTMEQVLQWDPQVIIVQNRYAEEAERIRSDPAWQSIRAVRDSKVFVAPEYVKPWGHPLPESIALGELWMAKQLHPELFKDIDMQVKADAFYKRFYRSGYEGIQELAITR